MKGHTRRPIGATRSQLGRYIEFNQNNAAGKLFDLCEKAAESSLEQSIGESIENPPRGSGRRKTKWIQQRMWYTRDVYTVNVLRDPGLADDGLSDNECVPRQPGQADDYHKGYALLNGDPWFNTHLAAANLRDGYAAAPNFKRDWVDDGPGLVYVDANSSRPATPEELRGELGFDSCSDDSCERERKALRDIIVAVRDDQVLDEESLSAPVEAPAEATAAASLGDSDLGGNEPPSQPGHAAGTNEEMARETMMSGL